MVYGRPDHLDVGRDMAHAWSASYAERHGDRVSPVERRHRAQEAVHGGGIHGSGVWVTERELNNWHMQNSLKYSTPFHPEYYSTPQPMSHFHCGLHDASIDFKSAARGIVPGYAGHVPRARDSYGEAASGGITPERGWKRAPKVYLGPMGSRGLDHGPEGAASRPHAYTRHHNRVSEEVKPGYAGHVPLARDTHGTSHYRDGFSHPKALYEEDGNISYRSTASHRFRDVPIHLRGNAEGWKTDRGHNRPVRERPPGLRERERLSGRARSAPRFWAGKKICAPGSDGNSQFEITV